jgi:hypothetical protein
MRFSREAREVASYVESDLHDEIYLEYVTPECFCREVKIRTRLDSRLKHAGMTDFGIGFG